MRRLIKKLTLWGICTVLMCSGGIPAHARRIKNVSPLEDLVGIEAARLITSLIDRTVPESIRQQALDFSCTLIKDAKEASKEFPTDLSWSREGASQAKSELDLSEQEKEKLASISGFGNLYSFLQYVVPGLTTSGIDTHSAFEIFTEKYQELRAELETVQRGLTHRKDVINAGINIAFRYLFLDAIAESSSPEDLSRQLEEDIEDVASILRLEDQVVERVLERLQQEQDQDQDQEDTEPPWFIQKAIEYIAHIPVEHFLAVGFEISKGKGDELSNEEDDLRDYLYFPFEFDPWDKWGETTGRGYIFMEYQEENGYKKVTKIFIGWGGPNARPKEVIYYKVMPSLDIYDTLVTHLKEIINNVPIKEQSSDIDIQNIFFERDFDLFFCPYEGLSIERLRALLLDRTTPLTSNPILLHLLSQKAALQLSNGRAYMLFNHFDLRELPDGFYLIPARKIYISSHRFNSENVTHEVTHSVFWGLLENVHGKKEEEDKWVQAIDVLKQRHKQFFRNICKEYSYTHLEDYDLGKLNELIAYMMGALGSGKTSFPSLDENGGRILEPILVEDVELLADLGFMPDWARPSRLLGERYEECRGKSIGEVGYLNAFYKRYVNLFRENPDLFGFVVPVFFAHLLSPCLLES